MGFAHAYVLGVFNLYAKVSLSGSIIDTVTKNENLRTVPVKCYGDDTPLTFHDTHLFSLLILLVHVNKFNIHDTLITLPLRLALLSYIFMSKPFVSLQLVFPLPPILISPFSLLDQT